MNTSLSFPILEASQAGEARRAAAAWASERGWSEQMTGRLALVVSELGRNLALHTSGGMLLLRSLSQGPSSGVEILSLDSGPGVSNFQQCLLDGFSTAGTAGTGLGAVKRASHVFAAHSQPGKGTALLSELWVKPPEFRVGRSWHCGAVSVAMPPEWVCGDTWAELHLRPGVLRVMVADGLGHGDYAAEASSKAAQVFLNHPELELPALFETMHDALRRTRGAAVGVAELDLERALVSFVGIGNTAATLISHEQTSSLVSLNGTVGAQIRSIRTFTYPWPTNGTLVMSTDGLKSHWQLKDYAGLLERHPSLIAGVLHRDYQRAKDDSTVVAIRVQT